MIPEMYDVMLTDINEDVLDMVRLMSVVLIPLFNFCFLLVLLDRARRRAT